MKRNWIIVLVFVFLIASFGCYFILRDREEEIPKGERIYSVFVGGTWSNTLYLELYDSGYLAVHDPDNVSPWGPVNLETFLQDYGENLVYSGYLQEDAFQETLQMLEQLPDEYDEELSILDATMATILCKGEQHYIILMLDKNKPHEEFIHHLFTLADYRYWLPIDEQIVN